MTFNQIYLSQVDTAGNDEMGGRLQYVLPDWPGSVAASAPGEQHRPQG